MRFIASGFAAAVVFGASAATPANGAPVIWNIDTSQSYITVDIPDQPVPGLGTLQFRNQTGTQTRWNAGNKTQVVGTLMTDVVLGESIQFLTTSAGDTVARPGSNYRPNPAAFNPLNTNAANPDGQYSDASTSLAAYGAKIRGLNGIALDVAYISATSVDYDITSAKLNFAGGSFTPNLNLDATALVNYDGLTVPFIGQILPDFVGKPLTFFAGDNFAGAITQPMASMAPSSLDHPDDYVLFFPISMTVPVLVGSGFDITGQITGQIVAYAHIVPEPSTFALALIGVLGLSAHAVRRRFRRE